MTRPATHRLMGRPVYILPDIPKVQVSAEFARIQDPDLVARTNAWMREFFGTMCIAKDGEVMSMDVPTFGGSPALLMNERTYQRIVAAMAAAQIASPMVRP